MLRFYRYIVIKSRSLTPLEQNIVAKSLNIQSFRLVSSNIDESRQHVPQTRRPYRAQRSEKSNVDIIDEENEKFINSLINRGDFYGIKTQKPKPEPFPVEVAVSKLQRWFSHNQRVNAESYVKVILIPLQRKNPAMLKLINLDPSSYIPFFIRCCGLIISDASEDQKLAILEHLLQAFKDNNLKWTFMLTMKF
uniref:Uncharacterized protein n=1 Tax=Panagrolaimus superbus TaxID=310955 RepID=A0A914YVZ6_9BILA